MKIVDVPSCFPFPQNAGRSRDSKQSNNHLTRIYQKTADGGNAVRRKLCLRSSFVSLKFSFVKTFSTIKETGKLTFIFGIFT